jgi:hypothetical protein
MSISDVARQFMISRPSPDPILIFGASAIVDRGDIIPCCRGRGGWEGCMHLGMPVDPGNLLMLGAIGSVPVMWRAVLRAIAQAERLRLGAGAVHGRMSK